MLRSTLRRLRRRPAPATIPYDMFSKDRTAVEVKQAKRLERVYHKGQDKVWDGKEVLAELLDKHGGIQLAPEQLEPLRRIFAIIFWGELAAWKVSAELALQLEPLEARLAATSQAHDEARHFYVLHDYLDLIGYQPEELPPYAARILSSILEADSLVKKITGMQLMVEPIALTLFQMVRANELEPVLCDLLRYYERDEARHVALGVNVLPQLFKKMSYLETLDLWQWQLRIIELQIVGMKELEGEFRALGFVPRDAMRLGMGKQLKAVEMMAADLDFDLPVVEVFSRLAEARVEWLFERPGAPNGKIHRARRALQIITRGDSYLDKTTPLTELNAAA